MADKKEEKKDKKEKKDRPSKTLAGGIIIQDHKIGDGPQAKKGDKVSMRYIGKLENGTEFDANKTGKPVRFRSVLR
jgi:FK506-binding nuclear protein